MLFFFVAFFYSKFIQDPGQTYYWSKMANTTIDTVPVSKLRELISLKDQAYKEAIKNGETFEVVEKIHKEKKELEKELIRRETTIT